MGIDPGTIKTGFGVVRLNADKSFTHVTHGVISLNAKNSVTERIGCLALDLDSLIKKYQPQRAVVEDVFLFKNARSALVLGQARGAIMAMFGVNNIPVQSYSASKVKSLIAGNGRAKKFQVSQMVALNLSINLPTYEDASDALALALAEIFSSKFC